MLLVTMWQLELSKRDLSAILVSLRNRRVRQDVTSQFNGASRTSVVAKGRLSDPDTSRSVFINQYDACENFSKNNIDIDHRLILTRSYYLSIVIEAHGRFYC